MDENLRMDIDELVTHTVHNMPTDLSEYIKSKTLEIQPQLFNKGTNSLELVVDTNILFQEVRSFMTRGSSFFLKIAQNPFVKFYGPSQLEEELFEKIKIKFPKEKKTRDLELSKCYECARNLLQNIEINDKYSQAAYSRAESYLKDRDVKDVNFVALNFYLNAHGVITKDKDISDISEVRTWNLRDVGEVVTKIHKGSMSFIVCASSIEGVYNLTSYIIKAIWNSVLALIKGLIKLFSSILSGSINSISKLPPEILAIGGIGIFIVLCFDSLRNSVGDFLALLWNEIKKILVVIKEIFKELWSIFKDLFDALKPILSEILEVYMYFMEQSQFAISELERLESSRAR